MSWFMVHSYTNGSRWSKKCSYYIMPIKSLCIPGASYAWVLAARPPACSRWEDKSQIWQQESWGSEPRVLLSRLHILRGKDHTHQDWMNRGRQQTSSRDLLGWLTCRECESKNAKRSKPKVLLSHFFCILQHTHYARRHTTHAQILMVLELTVV